MIDRWPAAIKQFKQFGKYFQLYNLCLTTYIMLQMTQLKIKKLSPSILVYIKNIANLMFININGPPLSRYMEPNQICWKLAVEAKIGR